MSHKPWMPLYIGDFIADTQHLGATETGIYIRLIMHCWQHGSIPTDTHQLALISHCDPRQWHRHQKTVLKFFDPVDAFTMHHKRVSTELLRYEELSNKRKGAAEQMLQKKAAKGQQLLPHLQSHKKDFLASEVAGGNAKNGKVLTNGGFEVQRDTPEAEAWAKHLGRPIAFGRYGIRTMPSQWPNGGAHDPLSVQCLRR